MIFRIILFSKYHMVINLIEKCLQNTTDFFVARELADFTSSLAREWSRDLRQYIILIITCVYLDGNSVNKDRTVKLFIRSQETIKNIQEWIPNTCSLSLTV